MPLTAKGSEIMSNMKKEYGEKKGESVFYASKNAGRISGVDNIQSHDVPLGDCYKDGGGQDEVPLGKCYTDDVPPQIMSGDPVISPTSTSQYSGMQEQLRTAPQPAPHEPIDCEDTKDAQYALFVWKNGMEHAAGMFSSKEEAEAAAKQQGTRKHEIKKMADAVSKHWATVYSKGKQVYQSGPHSSFEEAHAAGKEALKQYPSAKGFNTGHGEFGGHNNIQTHRREYDVSTPQPSQPGHELAEVGAIERLEALHGRRSAPADFSGDANSPMGNLPSEVSFADIRRMGAGFNYNQGYGGDPYKK